ncbi:hypothetical protein ACIP9H_33830 [Streptomyces sp. NPDC088732]|uniref:hypothetical protein n=1 Tax=Streptomyces sp. NPDC088732 TaxID=3365879 RepID=UPI0038107B15
MTTTTRRTSLAFHWISEDPTGHQTTAPWLILGDDGLQDTPPARYWPRAVRAAGINPSSDDLVYQPKRARAVLGENTVTVHLNDVRTTAAVPAEWSKLVLEQLRVILVVAYEPLSKSTPIPDLVAQLMASQRCVGAVIEAVKPRL